MPSTAYDTWLADPATDRVVLCDVQVRELLSGFAAVGGFPNVFSVTWSALAQTAVVAGGIFRRLDGAIQNDTALTVRTSIADVEANLGSYFQSGSVLYVSTTSGGDPDTFAAVMAVFTIFVATTAKDFVGGALYEPRLSGTLPAVHAEAEDPLFGVKTYPSGDVELFNGDRCFDALVRAWIWKNGQATFRLGGGTLGFSDYEVLAAMRIEDVAPNDGMMKLRLRAASSILETFLPLNTFTLAAYPNLGAGIEGTYIPILYGAMNDLPGLLVDDTVGAQVYQVADASVQTLFAVTAVRAVNRNTGAITTLTLTTHYTVSLAGCSVTVTSATYPASDYDIRIDAIGQPDGTGSYLKTFAGILEDILVTLLGEPSANLDAAAFTQADLDDPAELAVWMREGKTAAEQIRPIERSVLGSLMISRTGQWRPVIWSPGYTAATVPRLADEDMATWQPDDKLENLFYRVRVRYAKSWGSDTWAEQSATDDRTRYAYQANDTVTLETCLVDSSSATVLAQRYALMAGTPSVEIEVQERGLSLLTAQIWDRVLVTRERAPSLSGSYSLTAMEIVSIDKALSPPAVTVRLGDLRGFGERVGHWADSADPDWASTPPSERGRTGYWTDSAGLIDPLDPATSNLSLWW